jgi:hypothetical protein
VVPQHETAVEKRSERGEREQYLRDPVANIGLVHLNLLKPKQIKIES